MRWHKPLAAALLLVAAAALAGANVWFAAARSTIPLQLRAVVTGKVVRHEKHPPKDDVCLLNLGPHGIIHVDREVFDAVHATDALRKDRWSRMLFATGRQVKLGWSADVRGMVWAMPLVCLLALVTAAWASSISRHDSA